MIERYLVSLNTTRLPITCPRSRKLQRVAKVLCRSAYIDHRQDPPLPEVTVNEEFTWHLRRTSFGVMLRASQGRPRYAGQPITSWADEAQPDLVLT